MSQYIIKKKKVLEIAKKNPRSLNKNPIKLDKSTPNRQRRPYPKTSWKKLQPTRFLSLIQRITSNRPQNGGPIASKTIATVAKTKRKHRFTSKQYIDIKKYSNSRIIGSTVEIHTVRIKWIIEKILK